MEESDFEEESTHSYVSCADPDVTLSYIDEKLENVLGHFQKDFEGGVSAENLGSKFGGYGSFLSMYQRSPACPRPKTPPEVQIQVGARSNCSASSVEPEMSTYGSTSKAPASDVLVKLKKIGKSSNVGTSDSKQKSVTKNSSSAPSNHKTLRLRIKVGSSDLSSLKNVSSYSKQGLNMPPSTSQVNCLSEVEEGLLYGICDSPTQILMAMVSFPLHKDQLLSPLSSDLIQLGKKEEILKDAGYGSVNKSGSKRPHDELGVSDAQKSGKFPIGKKAKLKERVKHMPPSNVLDRNHILHDTENEADDQSCEELVCKTMKLPFLSCLSPSYVHLAKEFDKVSDSYVKGTLRKTNNTDQDVALMGSKPELEDNVVAFPDRSVKDTESVNTTKEVCEPDSKQLIKSGELKEDRHNTKQSVRREVKNKHSMEGGMEKLETEPEREISGTSKKPKTGKSRFSSVDQHGSNKILDSIDSNKNGITQTSVPKVKDMVKPSSHDRHNDRKRKLKENKESGDNMRLREAGVIESNGEKIRIKKRRKGSRFEGKELPFCSESCDRDRGVSQEKGIDEYVDADSNAGDTSNRCRDGEELRSGRISDRDEHHDTDSNAGDMLKRYRDGEGYNDIDKPGTTEKTAEISKDDNLDSREKATHSCGKESAYGENGSTEKYKTKKSGRSSGENFPEGESQQKNREEGSSALSKDNNLETVNKVQDLGALVGKTKESRSNKRPAKKLSVESNKEEIKEYQDLNKLDTIHFSSPQKPDRAKTFRGKSNHLEVTAEKLKNNSAQPTGTDQVEVLGHGSEISNTKKHNPSVTHAVGSRNLKQNGSKSKDPIGLSPLNKESTSQAVSNLIKEATALKHMADRLKNNGSNHDSIGVYFQATLKFLHAASLLESSNTARSSHTYGSTAKLCEFCAHEYEKNKDMGSAALAYKCMEVAYFRMTYSTHGGISRCINELQAVLQVNPSGESPSLLSEGENSNQTLAAEKVALSNTVRSSPRVTGSHVISSGNKSSLSQIFTFTQNVNLALDASRKAQIAYAGAAKGKPGDTEYSKEGIRSIKRALDFNFQDMESLLHVIRLAMESINR